MKYPPQPVEQIKGLFALIILILIIFGGIISICKILDIIGNLK